MITYEDDRIVKTPRKYRKMTIEQLEQEYQRLLAGKKSQATSQEQTVRKKKVGNITFYL